MNENVIEFVEVEKKFRVYTENTIFNRLLNRLNHKSGYIEVPVLNKVSFTIKKGEMFGIIGNNGVGKTTILKLMANIYKPDKGIITINGKVMPLLELGIGFNQELTAKDNITLYGKLLGLSNHEIKSKIDEILIFAELEKFADAKIKTFSSGMYARLAFATAIQVNPDILLVDEILSVGDIYFQKKSYEAFMSYKERKKTIVYVSHNLESIKSLCDRAMLIRDGRIVTIGSPIDVISEHIKFLR